MLTAVILASFANSWEVYVILTGIIYPIGIGLVYLVPILCGWEWFPLHKGLVSGLILSGYGLGGFIFGFISTKLVNPNNVKPH